MPLPIPSSSLPFSVATKVYKGASHLAEPLARSLLAQWAYGFPRVPRPAPQLTHGFLHYPAGMQAVAAAHLLEVMPRRSSGVLFDPFVGSGTTVIEAMRCGWRTVGADVSPLALFATTHHTWLPDEAQLLRVGEQASQVLRNADSSYEVQFINSAVNCYDDIDGNGDSASVAQDLLSHTPRPCLERQAMGDGGRRKGATTWKSWAPLREQVEIALSSSVGAKEKDRTVATSSLSEPSPLWFCCAAAQQRSERFRLRDPFASFDATVSAYIHAVRALRKAVPDDAAPCALAFADAREESLLERLGLEPADAVVASPPYAGVYDYLSHAREVRARLGARGDAILMGLRGTPGGRDWPDAWRSEREMGARKAMAKRRRCRATVDSGATFVEAWAVDQRDWLSAMRSNLRPGGRAALMVGDGEGSIDALDSTSEAAIDVGLDLLAVATIMSTKRARKAKGNRRPEHVLLLEAP